MHKKCKRIAILMTLMVLVGVGQVMAQTTVIGFHLGKSTYEKVKANLPKEANIKGDEGKSSDYNDGPAFYTTGTGYGIEGLESVMFCFDKKRILSEVRLFLNGRRLIDIEKILASKYRPIRSKYPDAFRLFKANSDYVYLYLPRNHNFTVDYMSGSTYHKAKLMERQTIEYKKAEERRNKKALEKEAAKEAAKF